MKFAYSFQRWSTKGQNKANRDSKARQEKSAEDWITNHSNGEYVLSKDVFIADGKSGWKGEHIAVDEFGRAKGELARFIEQVKDGTIADSSILLFDSWDRFSRLPVRKTIALLNDVVDNCGGIVVTGSREKRVLTAKLLDEDEYLLSGIIGEMNRATHESAEKSRKIKSSQTNKKVKMLAGEILPHTNTPRYYTYNKVKQCFEMNDLAKIVKGIIASFLDGKSLYQISNQLNADKVRSIRYANKQANWTRMAIKSLLESKCLYGEFLNIPNYFGEPVIDKPKWDKIQMMLVRNSGNKGRYSTDFVNIFRGIGFCSFCDRQMAIGVQVMNYKAGKPKAAPYRYIRCCARSNGLPCENNSQINLADVERSFFMDFLAKNPADFINGDDKKEIRAIDDEIADKQTRLNKIEKEATELGKLAGIITTAKLLKQGQDLASEQETLQRDIDSLNANRSSIMAAPISREMFNDLFVTTTEFNGDGCKDKTTKETLPYSSSIIEKNLQDNNTRIQLRNHLPNLISKVVFDTNEKTYRVFYRTGKEVFKSERLDEQHVARKALKLISSKAERAKTLKMTGKGELQAYLESIKAKIRAK